MKRIIPLIAVPLVVMAGLFLFSSTQPDDKIIEEIVRLEKISYERDMTPEDFMLLKEMTQDDHIAFHYAEEAEWLALNNYSEHVGHSLGYLYNYVFFGTYSPCAPHEVEHMALYARANDTERLEHELEEIDEVYSLWLTNARMNYPAERVDSLSEDLLDVISRLKSGERSEELYDKAEFVSGFVLC